MQRKFGFCYNILWPLVVSWGFGCHQQKITLHLTKTKDGTRQGGLPKQNRRLTLNISSVVEFQRWWVLKSKRFGQESTCHQEKIFKKFLRVMTVCQKVPKLYFQSQFWMSKINRIFSKKNLSKNMNLGDHYLLKTFFSKLNF